MRGKIRIKLPLWAKITLGALALMICLLIALSIIMRLSPIKIGVLLNLSGPESLPYRQVLEWARENTGRNIELVYVDSNGGDIMEKAKTLLDDHSIRVVIGPQNSDEAMALAPLFIEKKKLLISPTTTSGDLYRAFAGEEYFWRTVESDVAQARTIMDILAEKGTKKVALVYADTSYGKTFYDWIGFYATEKNIEVTSIQALKTNPDYDTLAANAAMGEPDYIILTMPPKDSIELKNRFDKNNVKSKLFLTDLSQFDSLIAELGERAEGLESTGPSTDPESGFEKAYRERFSEDPPIMMASTYDAFMMAATTLARQEYAHRYSLLPFSVKENTATSLKQILFGDIGGNEFRWDELGPMLDDIGRGNIPTLTGATGIVAYDKEKGVDPVGTFYAYSIVKDGKFHIERLISANKGRTVSAAGTIASDHLAYISDTDTQTNLPEKKDLQAVIIATTDQWQNYRHQSDAFAMYQLLRSNNVPDDKITLFLIDDIANFSKNNPKPSLFHIKDGSDNYSSSAIDFSGDKVTAENLKQTLLNLDSDNQTNLLVYVAGHGGTGSNSTDSANNQLGDEGIIRFSNGNNMTSTELKSVIEEMAGKQKYRQMMVVLETCFSGAMGKDITTPNVLFMTAASDQEVSYGANYSPKIKQWLADNFTYQLIAQINKDPESSIADLYSKVYKNVPGSHVTLLNWKNFGNLTKTPISSFLRP
ncbi:MAG: C13 family peptidase [Patescibacteria group bacterium]